MKSPWLFTDTKIELLSYGVGSQWSTDGGKNGVKLDRMIAVVLKKGFIYQTIGP